jgi:2-keto-3-deoxy-L-rhamnonate aldolase RhmA
LKAHALRKALQQGQVPIGTWLFGIHSPGITRLLAGAGVDFIVIDMEHSGFGTDTVRALLAETHSLELPAWVRPPAGEYHLIAPLLDAGADGIIVPMVETPEQAKRVANACRYPPKGNRGAAFSIAHDDFLAGGVPEKIKAADEKIVCGLLIESQQGVDNLEKITAVPGVDLLWVGFLDLSISLGTPGDFAHPKFTGAVARILKVSAERKIPVGIMVKDSAQGIKRIREGFHCLSYWGDIWLLQQALAEGIGAIRREVPEARTQKAG